MDDGKEAKVRVSAVELKALRQVARAAVEWERSRRLGRGLFWASSKLAGEVMSWNAGREAGDPDAEVKLQTDALAQVIERLTKVETSVKKFELEDEARLETVDVIIKKVDDLAITRDVHRFAFAGFGDQVKEHQKRLDDLKTVAQWAGDMAKKVENLLTLGETVAQLKKKVDGLHLVDDDTVAFILDLETKTKKKAAASKRSKAAKKARTE